MKEGDRLNLEEAARLFLAGLGTAEAAASQTELQRFVRWFGREKALSSLSPHEVANYAEHLSASDTDHARRLDIIRRFLTHAKGEGWTQANLSLHLKAKKDKPRASPGRRTAVEAALLTRQGYDAIQQELAALRARRPKVLEEIRRAAADKDFRENAPLHAAREEMGHIDGRIKELETLVKSATCGGRVRGSQGQGVGR